MTGPARYPEWIDLIRPTTTPITQPIVPGSSAIGWYAEVSFDGWVPPAGSEPPSEKQRYRKPPIVADVGGWSVAEIELVKRMQAGGWNAGWVDGFGSAPQNFASWIVDPGELPTPLRRAYRAITNDTGRPGNSGQPDVIAWRGETLADCVLVEYKGPSDKVRPGQDAWLEAALRAGLSPDQFMVAKWPKSKKRATSGRAG